MAIKLLLLLHGIGVGYFRSWNEIRSYDLRAMSYELPY